MASSTNLVIRPGLCVLTRAEKCNKSLFLMGEVEVLKANQMDERERSVPHSSFVSHSPKMTKNDQKHKADRNGTRTHNLSLIPSVIGGPHATIAPSDLEKTGFGIGNYILLIACLSFNDVSCLTLAVSDMACKLLPFHIPR